MRPASALLLVLGALVLAPACYNLPHIDPGPRWIDQFNSDAGMPTPTWGAFAEWTCGTERAPNPAPGGSDGGGADGGPADAAAAQAALAAAAVVDAGGDGGLPMACQMGPGDGKGRGLVQPFAFADSSNDVQFTVTTQATSGPVDFTGFHQFVFSANLTTPSTAPLPADSTVFQVELNCSKNRGEIVLTQEVNNIKINAQGWHPFRLPLAQFQSMLMSSNGPCLSQIDGIRFVVIPGMNAQPQVAGTLSLDNISLQN